MTGVVVIALAIGMIGCSAANVSQNAVGPSPVKCQPTVTGLPATMSASGGQMSARVITTADCSWSVTASASWLRVEPSSGQGERLLTVQVDENQSAISRTGEIDLNGVRMQVTQAAAPPPPPPAPTPPPSPAPTPPPPPAPTPPGPPAPTPPAPTPPPPPAPTPPAPTPPPPPAPTPPAPPAPTPPAPPAPTPPAPQPPTTSIELSGTVSGLAGVCPTLTFTASGYRVNTDDDTKFTRGNCKHLTNGMDVAIVGERQSNGTVYAVSIALQNDWVAD